MKESSGCVGGVGVEGGEGGGLSDSTDASCQYTRQGSFANVLDGDSQRLCVAR